MSVVGIDIGGANLKASDGSKSISKPFPLWKQPEELAAELALLLAEFHPYGPIAATMTGELADCFSTRAEGVRFIVNAIQQASSNRQIAIWQTGGEFLTPEEAMEFPELVAAANWHALATWAGRACPAGDAILIDIGSTTTDIIPIQNGIPVSTGLTDLERLQSGELVYSGVRRTPLFAVSQTVNIHNVETPLAAELFATMLDVALLLGDDPEEPDNTDTANGKPATVQEARNRIARSFCSDCDQLSNSELNDIAQQIQTHQLKRLSCALEKVLTTQSLNLSTVLLSGEGESLASKLLDTHFPSLLQLEKLSMTQMLGPDHSESACAFALVKLGTERL